MKNTRQSWPSAAQGADWFRLNRHDDPEPADPPEPEGEPDPSGDPDPDPEPEGADKLGDAGKKALDAMKRERAAAKKEAAEAKKRADDLARQVAAFEDRDKSELEKATTKAERLAEQAAKATKRAVLAEVKAAAAEFADPEDAAAFLDLTSYAGDDGEIDTNAIVTDLETLLERKPHLRKAVIEPEKKKAPKPDPGQGARPTGPPADFRTASRQELEAELAQSAPGFRLR
ncbi:hypothetical protein [Streptomyces formicae]|uniref:Scaffolding protein n=1 Tax=Streptomyces formicae TaxID=1616117 RepID=A0ABY3WMD2_9ACTN|nr:hypothetical protein [Streptomyces formicae]UNM13774.1 hypothetical protein J4032_22010 [Streptomyces formicae]